MAFEGQEAESFLGTDRFLVQRRIGAGAYGVVYQAWDRVERSPVALKVLRFNEADALYRFKKGFRSLADLRHPNLVQFYELHSQDGLFFFSMELIQGLDFIEALWGPGQELGRPAFATVRQVVWQLARGLHAVHESGRLHRDIKPPNVLVTPCPPAGWAGTEVKLLDFGLVAELELGRRPTAGAGQLIGTPAYMAPELANGDPGSPAADWYGVGVMLYQALCGELPFGGSLVQILTRKQRGKRRQDLREQMPDLPADLEEICYRLLHPLPEQRPSGDELLEWLEDGELGLAGELPEPLATLPALVGEPSGEPHVEPHVEPHGEPATPNGTRVGLEGPPWRSSATPSSAALVSKVHGSTLQSSTVQSSTVQSSTVQSSTVQSSSVQSSTVQSSSVQSSATRRLRRSARRLEGSGPSSERAPFIGRRDLIGELAEAFESSRERLTLVYLKGPSGIGKSALVRRFLSLVEERDEQAVALYGRCYFQESVPYKALDSLIDALSRHLATLADDEVRELLPENLPALVRLFPVLSRVGEIAGYLRAESSAWVVSPQTLRQQAVAALRQLLDLLGRRQSLVLAIDDLQWGDLDSLILLEELFQGKNPPRLLWIGTYRSEDEAGSPFLKTLTRQRTALRRRGVQIQELEVRQLGREDAEELMRVMLGEQSHLSDAAIADLLRDAAGSPLYLSELARFTAEAHEILEPSPTGDRKATEVRVRDLILLRVAQLGAPARRLLEVVAVAGKPIDLAVARQAAGLLVEGPAALAELRTSRLIRVSQVEGREEIESYHDRVREAVCMSLEPESWKERNRRLALALEATGRADPETLAVLFQATAEEERARRYVAVAAERAEETLAFERAARLYQMAVELLPATSDDRATLQLRLARALANAGRNRDAADTYLLVVGESGVLDPLEMQRNAAEKLLISGHIDRGLAVLRHVLRTVDLQLDQESWRTLLSLRLLRWRLRWRGLRFVAKSESEIPPETLRRIDVCWSVEIGLCQVDVLRAAEFHARHLLWALEAGDPQRVARGLAMEVFFGAMEGLDPAQALEQAREIAGRVEGHYAASLTEMAAGMVACSRGEWQRAYRRLARAEDQLRENRQGMVWERDTIYQFHTLAMFNLGRWRELFARFPKLLEQARLQGNLYLEVHLRHWVEILHYLAEDLPEEAQAALDAGTTGWSSQGFHLQHFGRLIAQTRVALYQNEGQIAWDLMAISWPELERSMIQRIGMIHVQSWDLRGRCALAAAAESRGSARKRLLGVAATAIQQLQKANSSWAKSLADCLAAGLAWQQGHSVAARAALAAAEPVFAANEMMIHAATVRFRLAQLENRDFSAAAAELQDFGIRNPHKMSRVLLPGPWNPST